MDLLTNNSPDFLYDPENNITFFRGLNAGEPPSSAIFTQRRCMEIKNFASQWEHKKHERFTHFILPKQPSDLTFTENC